MTTEKAKKIILALWEIEDEEGRKENAEAFDAAIGALEAVEKIRGLEWLEIHDVKDSGYTEGFNAELQEIKDLVEGCMKERRP